MSAMRDIARVAAEADLIALFVDLDGTLIDVAPSPDTVVVPPDLAPTLLGVERALGGAFAVVSGRRLDAIDRLLAPFRAAAGLHEIGRAHV